MKSIIWISTVLCWLAPSSLASFAADVCYVSNLPKVTQPQLAAVLCCRDGYWCDSDIDGKCHGDSVGFAEASDICASRAARMCTFLELASRLCCDTGCGYDNLATWYDNCAWGPCVHGTCTSTKESYMCRCDAGFAGDDCDVEIPSTFGTFAPWQPPRLPSPPGPSQPITPNAGVDGSQFEIFMFGAQSFDFLIDAAERMKGRMLKRTTKATSDAMEALGMDDLLSRMTDNGLLKDLEAKAKDKLEEVFGNTHDVQFDIVDSLEPILEQANSALKTCKATGLSPQAQAAVPPATDRGMDTLKDAFKKTFAAEKVGATVVLGLEDQTHSTRSFASLEIGFGSDATKERDERVYKSVSGVVGGSAFGSNGPVQHVGLNPRLIVGVSSSSSADVTAEHGPCTLKFSGRWHSPTPLPDGTKKRKIPLFGESTFNASTMLEFGVTFSIPCQWEAAFPATYDKMALSRFKVVDLSLNVLVLEIHTELAKKTARAATVLTGPPPPKKSFISDDIKLVPSMGMQFFPWKPMAASVLRRSAEAQSVESQVAKARVLAEGVATGELVTPFCFGDCEADGNGANDARRSISGLASLRIESDCGQEMRAAVEEITFGGVAYVLGGDTLRAVLEAAHVEGLGLRDADVSMHTPKSGNVLFAAVGAPSYDDGNALSFLGADLQIQVTAEKISDYKRLRLTAGMRGDDSEEMFRIRDIQGHFGLSLHMQYEKLASYGMSKEYKVNLPIAVCVENCEDSASRRDLYFSGELGVEFNPTPQVSGDLTAAGWWYKAFGIPFLHLGDMILGLSMDLSTRLPSRLIAGGAVCLGKADNCENRVAPYIEARGYVGLSWKTIQDNFFIAMVSRLTIGDLFDVFAEFAPALSSVKRLLWSKILESGIYPYDESACDAGAELDTNCFAVVSFAFIDKELDFSSGNVVKIPSGVQVSGKLNLGGWEIQVYMKADEASVIADVRMDPLALTIGGFDLMRIGERLENGHVVGGPKFYMAIISEPQALFAIDISGAFEIPLIGATGEVSILVNEKEFSFRTSVSLFWGIWSSTTYTAWNWGFSRFNMGLEDVSFGVVKLEELSFAFDSAEKLGQFKGKISVLSIVGVGVHLAVRVSGVEFFLMFRVSASVAGATLTVSGQGTLRKPLGTSDWDLTPSVSFDLEALKEDIEKAVKVVAKAAEKVWGAVTDFAEDGVKFMWEKVGGFVLDTFSKAREFLGKVLKSPVVKKLADNVKKILKGDFGGFFKGVGGAIKGVFTSESVRNHQITTLSTMDEYNCNEKRESWEVKSCLLGLSCSRKSYSRMIPNEPCLKERAQALQAAEEKAEDIAVLEEEVDDSKAGNPGLVAVLAGVQIPTPRIGLVGGAVLQTRNGLLPDAKVAVTIDAGVQALAAAGDHRASAVEGTETPFSVPSSFDYSSPEAFEASVREATKSIVDKAKDAVLSKQAGVKLAKADLLINTPAPTKLPLLPWSSRSGDALDVSGVAAPVVGAAKPVTHVCSEGTPWEAPDLEFTASQCREASVDVIDTENLAGPPFGVTTSFVCGTHFKKVLWQAKYGSDCGRATSSVVEQIVTIVPAEIELTHEPGPATVSAAEFERPSEGNTWMPQWDVECYLSMLIDSEDVLVSSTCGRQVVERTWTASIDFEGTAVDTRSCEPPPTKSYVQFITVLTAENC